MKQLWIISELFYPEETSTGHYLTQIALGLGLRYEVGVLCSQPTYSQRGKRSPRHEQYEGVTIYRCFSTTLNKNILPCRILNFLTVSLSLFLSALRRFKKGDKALVVTNPPLLPFFILMACRLKGAKSVLLVHDVYPEVFEIAGICSRKSVLYRFIDRLSLWLYQGMDRVVVLGRDMARVAEGKGAKPEQIEIITNWADLSEVYPIPKEQNPVCSKFGLSDQFVVQYCGNMGRTHGLECLVGAAEALESEADVLFMLVGSGARYNWLEEFVQNQSIKNTLVLPRCSREDLNHYLNACDIGVISFMPGMSGVSVPSRMYNIMAAGKPILAIADNESELAMVVSEERIGWVVNPGDREGIIAAIKEAKSNSNELIAMGQRARQVAETKYSLESVIEKYNTLFESL